MEKKKFVLAKTNVARVIDTSTKPAKVSGTDVARALGATPTGHELPANLPPDTYLALFEKVAQEIVSTGGRPARKDETERKKIPLTRDEWAQLQVLAEGCKEQHGVSVSPAQLGGILLREGLKNYVVTTECKLPCVADSFVADLKADRKKGKIKSK